MKRVIRFFIFTFIVSFILNTGVFGYLLISAVFPALDDADIKIMDLVLRPEDNDLDLFKNMLYGRSNELAKETAAYIGNNLFTPLADSFRLDPGTDDPDNYIIDDLDDVLKAMEEKQADAINSVCVLGDK